MDKYGMMHYLQQILQRNNYNVYMSICLTLNKYLKIMKNDQFHIHRERERERVH